MSILRGILRDLVDRRLWPVAVILVVALVAVPVVLGRGGSEPAPAPEPAEPTATQPQADPGAQATVRPAVSLDPGPQKARHRGGRTKNPFRQPATKKPAVDPSPEQQTGGGQGSGDAQPEPGPPSSGSPSSGSPGPQPDPTPKPTTPKPATPVDPFDTYRVTLRFGPTGDLHTIDDVPRLAALPSATDPFFVYLGVLEDGKTAVFLVSADAKATGDGTCRPTNANCQTIELQKGETEYFDLKTGDTVVQYEMELVRIERRAAATAAKAAQARARHSSFGAAMLRDAAQRGQQPALRGYRYLPREGVLARAERRRATPGKAATATQGKAATDPQGKAATDPPAYAPADRQPGLPVWRTVPRP